MRKIGEVYTNLEERVHDIIKDRIIYHQLKAGERVIDRNIAEELGVSRSMVRQVFSILVKEELLRLIPRNGFYVREITKREVEEIYNVRKILEGYAIRLAVQKIGQKDIDKLEKVFQGAERDLKDKTVRSFINTDTQFHQTIIDHCGNEHLKKLIEQYENHYIFYRVIDLSRLERAKSSYLEHYKIFEALKDRNTDIASKLMEEHIENAKQIILQNFDQYTFGKIG
jgi:DNA-binding GntR family transcriptional regulator